MNVDLSTVGSSERLRSLFAPRSIAVVGSSEGSSWSKWLLASIALGGRDAPSVVLVNPHRREVFGRATVSTLRELGAPVDLAFVMTPAATVESILEEVAAVGIRNVVVLASGFADGGVDGEQRQRQLAARACELNLTLLGPNTTGFVNARARAVPWAVAVSPPLMQGPVAGIFESGSITRAAFEFTQAHAIGTSLWVSVGNAAVVSTMDILEYALEDDNTRTIALFLETVREPQRFMMLAWRALALGKPIVAMKTGRSAAGKRAGTAHTGAIATDDAVVDAAMRQCGVVRARSVEELVVSAGLFGYSRCLPKGRRMGVITSSGGGCSIIADRAEDDGLQLPAFADSTATAMREVLPPYATLVNPLDVTGAGNSVARNRPTKAEDDLLEIAARDPGIDFVFSLMNASFLAARLTTADPVKAASTGDGKVVGPVPIDQRLRILGAIVNESPVPVFLASSTCLDVAPEQREMLMSNGIHLLAGVDLAITALRHACWWVEQRESHATRPLKSAAATRVFAGSRVFAGVWPEDMGRELLARFGVPLVPARLVKTSSEAQAEAARLAVPIALKICASGLAHKTEIGGVRLNVPVSEAAAAYAAIAAETKRHVAPASVRGMLLSPMRTPGAELLVGITNDSVFGRILTVGLGGVWVEIMKDASIRVLPVDRREIRVMLEELRGAALLSGTRGMPPADLDKVVDVILGIAEAALAIGPRLEALEVNPLRVCGSDVEALDVLVSLRDVGEEVTLGGSAVEPVTEGPTA